MRFLRASFARQVLLTKLNFPAPMARKHLGRSPHSQVSINGPAEISRRRPDRITLEAVHGLWIGFWSTEAVGIPSSCANASENLGYRWVGWPVAICANSQCFCGRIESAKQKSFSLALISCRQTVTSGNLNFDNYPEITTNAATLTIPGFVLEPDLTAGLLSS